jgi:alpha-tubulin suppressor-like RCC1 family protein
MSLRAAAASAGLCLMLGGLSACSDSTGPDTTSAVATVQVRAPEPSLVRGTELQLRAVLKGPNGQVLGGRTVEWTSSDTSVAVVSADSGLVYGLQSGFVTITATSEGTSGTVALQVLTGLDFASIRIDPAGRSLLLGSVLKLTAQPYNGSGEAMGAIIGLAWTILDPGVATFDGGLGPVNGYSAFATFGHTGTVRIKAQADEISDVDAYQVVQASWTSVSTGRYSSCGVTTTHASYCWGAGHFGQLANGSYENEQVPVRTIGAVTFDAVSAGNLFGCGLAGGAAWCWGNGAFNNQGLIGTPIVITGAPSLVSIATNGGHACGLASTGQAYCWGENWSGQLGNGQGEGASVGAVSVSGGHQFTSLSAGAAHNCAIALDASAWCWGADESGQLGDGSPTACSSTYSTYCSTVPVQVAGSHQFTAVSGGHFHTCALATDGLAWCWGNNNDGQLGSGPIQGHQAEPVPVAGDLQFTAIAAGGDYSGGGFTCAIATDGKAWCWGSNESGQLGTSGGPSSVIPVAVQTSERFVSIDAGAQQACAVTAAGVAWCWGTNLLHELGAGRPFYALVPMRLPG